jgi:hypothetical protein
VAGERTSVRAVSPPAEPQNMALPKVRVRGIDPMPWRVRTGHLTARGKAEQRDRGHDSTSQPADPRRERGLPPGRNRAMEAARTNRQESRWYSLVWITEDRRSGGRADRRPPGGSTASLWPKERPGR